MELGKPTIKQLQLYKNPIAVREDVFALRWENGSRKIRGLDYSQYSAFNPDLKAYMPQIWTRDEVKRFGFREKALTTKA